MIKNRETKRRGSTYIIVVGTALIVSVLSLSALTIQRIQRRSFTATADIEQARLFAQGAIRIGMLRIENDPDWRYNFTNGAWETTEEYTLEGFDPSDGDLADATEDPLVLVGTGKSGNAVQKMQVSLAPENRALNCLEVAMQAGNEIVLRSAYMPYWSIISSNGSVYEEGFSAIYCDVEAVGSIDGNEFYGGVTSGIEPREMPPENVFDYYKTQGTWIDITTIPQAGSENLLHNGEIESGTIGWFPYFGWCQLGQTTQQAHTGEASMAVTQRLDVWAGPGQNVTGMLVNGGTYSSSVWLKQYPYNSPMIGFLWVETTMEAKWVEMTPWGSWPAGDLWQHLTGVRTVSWAGTLIRAEWYALSGYHTYDYYMDDAELREVGLSGRVISRQLISPASNPFGNETNPEGIYVIDCKGQDLHIERSRIVGTLVLLNPGEKSSIRAAAVNWQPAAANFPALLVDGDFAIEATNTGLSEFATRTNFNPPGTSYEGLGEDLDLFDIYPSLIQGVVYVSGHLRFANSPSVYGVVVANSVEVANRLDLIHNPSYLSNPPPGFSGPEEIKIVLESATKVVD